MPSNLITLNISLILDDEAKADLTLLISRLERIGCKIQKKRLYPILVKYAAKHGINEEKALNEIAFALTKNY